jgi:hypothetical protein
MSFSSLMFNEGFGQRMSHWLRRKHNHAKAGVSRTIPRFLKA